MRKPDFLRFSKLANFPYQYILAIDWLHFHLALTKRVAEGVDEHDSYPIIHISAHGDLCGIKLTEQHMTQEIVSWQMLSNYLAAVNRAMNNGLGICLASCCGGYGRTMAEVILPEQIPMFWILGTLQPLDYCDAALAFAVFYRGFQRGVPEEQLIAAMNAASGTNGFRLEYGHLVHSAYSDKMARLVFPGLFNSSSFVSQ